MSYTELAAWNFKVKYQNNEKDSDKLSVLSMWKQMWCACIFGNKIKKQKEPHQKMVSYYQEGKRGIFPPFQNIWCFSFILSQFYLALTKFIEKYIDIYNTK
jgi:hypothetical protein